MEKYKNIMVATITKYEKEKAALRKEITEGKEREVILAKSLDREIKVKEQIVTFWEPKQRELVRENVSTTWRTATCYISFTCDEHDSQFDWVITHYLSVSLYMLSLQPEYIFKVKNFVSWKNHVQEKKQEEKLTQQLVLPWRKRRAMAKIMSSWRSIATANRRVQEEEYWKQQVKDVSTQVVLHYEKATAELRKRLSSTELQLKFEKQDNAVVEEKLRQAFLRGVSALNREAFSLFRDAIPAVPVPAPAPPVTKKNDGGKNDGGKSQEELEQELADFSAQGADAAANIANVAIRQGMGRDGVSAHRLGSTLDEELPRSSVPAPL